MRIAAAARATGTSDPSKVFTCYDWTPEEVLREKENWYTMGKLAAERLAWAFSKEPHRGAPFELAVMLPCLILGPMLPGQPHLNTSSAALVGYMDGSKKEVRISARLATMVALTRAYTQTHARAHVHTRAHTYTHTHTHTHTPHEYELFTAALLIASSVAFC
jgi:nucleoside-diphosphate-sugar epimerase